jgi:hypothetical protein
LHLNLFNIETLKNDKRLRRILVSPLTMPPNPRCHLSRTMSPLRATPEPEATLLHQLSQLDVLDDFHGQPLVGADSSVGRTPQKLKRPRTGVAARFWGH